MAYYDEQFANLNNWTTLTSGTTISIIDAINLYGAKARPHRKGFQLTAATGTPNAIQYDGQADVIAAQLVVEREGAEGAPEIYALFCLNTTGGVTSGYAISLSAAGAHLYPWYSNTGLGAEIGEAAGLDSNLGVPIAIVRSTVSSHLRFSIYLWADAGDGTYEWLLKGHVQTGTTPPLPSTGKAGLAFVSVLTDSLAIVNSVMFQDVAPANPTAVADPTVTAGHRRIIATGAAFAGTGQTHWKTAWKVLDDSSAVKIAIQTGAEEARTLGSGDFPSGGVTGWTVQYRYITPFGFQTAYSSGASLNAKLLSDTLADVQNITIASSIDPTIEDVDFSVYRSSSGAKPVLLILPPYPGGLKDIFDSFCKMLAHDFLVVYCGLRGDATGKRYVAPGAPYYSCTPAQCEADDWGREGVDCLDILNYVLGNYSSYIASGQPVYIWGVSGGTAGAVSFLSRFPDKARAAYLLYAVVDFDAFYELVSTDPNILLVQCGQNVRCGLGGTTATEEETCSIYGTELVNGRTVSKPISEAQQQKLTARNFIPALKGVVGKVIVNNSANDPSITPALYIPLETAVAGNAAFPAADLNLLRPWETQLANHDIASPAVFTAALDYAARILADEFAAPVVPDVGVDIGINGYQYHPKATVWLVAPDVADSGRKHAGKWSYDFTGDCDSEEEAHTITITPDADHTAAITPQVTAQGLTPSVSHAVSIDGGSTWEPQTSESDGTMVIDGVTKSAGGTSQTIEWFLMATVMKPSITPSNEEPTSEQTITLACDTEDAVIYYSVDGGDPDTLYVEPFPLTANCTVKAIATKANWNDSEVASDDFLMTVMKPTITPSDNAPFFIPRLLGKRPPLRGR